MPEERASNLQAIIQKSEMIGKKINEENNLRLLKARGTHEELSINIGDFIAPVGQKTKKHMSLKNKLEFYEVIKVMRGANGSRSTLVIKSIKPNASSTSKTVSSRNYIKINIQDRFLTLPQPKVVKNTKTNKQFTIEKIDVLSGEWISGSKAILPFKSFTIL